MQIIFRIISIVYDMKKFLELQVRKRYPQNIIISYLNINSIRNKLNDLKTLISDSVDKENLSIAESKLYESFLNGEIALEGFRKPYRLDVTASSGGLLIYAKAT